MSRRWLELSVAAFILLLLLGAGSTRADVDSEVTISAALSRDSIGMDETAVLEVVVAGNDQNLPAPQLPGIAAFDVYSQGRSSNISIVNGQMSTTVNYRYILMPKKPGVYPIQDIAAVYKNRRYVANGLTLTVLDKGTAAPPELEQDAQTNSGESRDYFMAAEVDTDKPYVNQQVTLTLKFYTAVQYYSTPDLTPPTTTGFWTEVLGSKPPYHVRLNNRNYRVLEIKYALFPTQTGKLTIGRGSIRTTVAATRRGNSVFDDFFGRGEEVTVRSKPLTIDVRALPKTGRPAEFSGTIGQFTINAATDKREVEVNQPVSVTVTITGWGNIKSVAEPPIGDLQDFRVYRASSNEELSKQNDLIGGKKVFEEVFIPNRPGELEIPSLTFSYFNPKSGGYETKRTNPIKLKVTPGEGYAAGVDVPFATPGVSIGSQANDIRYIKTDLGPLHRRGEIILATPLYLFVNGLPVLALIGLVVFRSQRQRLAADQGYARARGASRMARKRLAAARSKATAAQAEAFYAELALAAIAYIADKLDISPHGLTRDRIAELLKESRAHDDLTGEILTFLQRCDFARFAAASVTQEDITRDLAAAEQVMVKMEGVTFGR
jgi:hypothetical protein